MAAGMGRGEIVAGSSARCAAGLRIAALPSANADNDRGQEVREKFFRRLCARGDFDGTRT